MHNVWEDISSSFKERKKVSSLYTAIISLGSCVFFFHMHWKPSSLFASLNLNKETVREELSSFITLDLDFAILIYLVIHNANYFWVKQDHKIANICIFIYVIQ